MKKSLIPALVIGLVLLVDQASKLLVKTQMFLGEHFNVLGKYFQIYFIENNGMAFGYEFGGDYGKLFLTLFRIAAVIFLGVMLSRMVKKSETPKGALVSLSLILAGALGNIIDSVFYGVLFGYESLFHGRVVDMLYFPLYEGFLPDWIPFKGGDYFVFFRPVFNIADMAISTGVGMLLVWQNRYFPQEPKKAVE
ncbi:MAG: lipoprotein signal peptidase [Sphingobacteriaceae bacterium]|nr:lipoprotein signal peptidase [Sphingobacteriaceae bacterium]